MAIRQSGLEAAAAAQSFLRDLETLIAKPVSALKPLKALHSAILLPTRRVREAVQTDDEDALALALLPVPGTGRDLDSVGFSIEDYPELKPSYDNLISKSAEFYLDCDPSLRSLLSKIRRPPK